MFINFWNAINVYKVHSISAKWRWNKCWQIPLITTKQHYFFCSQWLAIAFDSLVNRSKMHVVINKSFAFLFENSYSLRKDRPGAVVSLADNPTDTNKVRLKIFCRTLENFEMNRVILMLVFP